MKANKIFVLGCFALALLVAPTLALADPLFRIRSKGFSVSLTAHLGDTGFPQLVATQTTDETPKKGEPVVCLDSKGKPIGCTHTFLESLNFTSRDGGTTCMFPNSLHPSADVPKQVVTVSPDKRTVTVTILRSTVDCLVGSPPPVILSLSFMRDAHSYAFKVKGKVEGTTAAGTHIDDQFEQKFAGATVSGLVFGALFPDPLNDNIATSEISTFKGDPDLSPFDTEPFVLP